jgi:hypothetical protein
VKPPDELRERVGRDLKPVRPLLAPWQRVLLLVPAAVLVFVAGPSAYGLRSDLSAIGPLLAWGGSVLQLLVGLVLIGLALREAVPADAASRTSARFLLLGGVGLMILLGLVTNIVSPEPVARVESFFDWYYCWRGAVLVGIPFLLALLVLLMRGLVGRPLLAGALAGMGTGAAVDGGWRLTCNYSNPTHVYGSHGGAVVALTVLGVVVMLVASRRTKNTKRTKATK